MAPGAKPPQVGRGFAFEARKPKRPPPVLGERAFYSGKRGLPVVVVDFAVCSFFEGARGENLCLAGIRPRKPGGLVPVEVVDDIRIFGVGRVIFAGEDLRLHLHPASPECLNRTALLGLLRDCLSLDGTATPPVNTTGVHGRDGLSRSLGNAHSQRGQVRHVRPRQEITRRRVVDEERLHRRGYEIELVHGLQAEDLLDRAGHIYLRVEGAVLRYTSPGAIMVHLLHDVWADDIARATVTVDVVDAVLRVVFLDEDRRSGPNGAVADDIDKTAKGQVIIGLHGLRRRRAAGVIRADPHELQLGYRAVCHVVGEVLRPDIDAELVGNAEIELRVVLDRVVYQVGERGVRRDRVVVVELALHAGLVSHGVVIEVDPQRLFGRAGRRQEAVVLDVLAVILKRDAGLYSPVPQVARLLVGNRIAAVGGVVAEPVRRLDVVGVGRHGLDNPVVTVGRLAARVVEVVQKREALHQRVRVGRDAAEGCIVAENCQGGFAVAAGHVAQDLIVGAIFTNDHEDVLDLRGSANLFRDGDRRGNRAAARGRIDIF